MGSNRLTVLDVFFLYSRNLFVSSLYSIDRILRAITSARIGFPVEEVPGHRKGLLNLKTVEP